MQILSNFSYAPNLPERNAKRENILRLASHVVLSLFFALASTPAQASPEKLYQAHCASCHNANRLGALGPALLPENLVRVPKKQAAKIIKHGLPATQMLAFEKQLNDIEIEELVNYIYTPLKEVPTWDKAEITASRVAQYQDKDLPNEPQHDADPLNMFIVVESGDHHISVLDGDKLEVINRFKSRHALHGGPKYSPTGRFVYFASRDGWVSKYDMYNLKTIAEVRAGINTRNLAVSSDGRYVMVANYLPHTLVVLDANDLRLLEIIPIKNRQGLSSRASAVYDATPRKSFIVALKDLQEVWEIQYSDDPVYYGRVHDYRYEGPPEVTERFPIRQIELDDYLDDFFFDQSYEHLIGAARNNKNGQVINLLVGRKIADLDLPGLPHLGSGISWQYQGKDILATPNLKQGEIAFIDMKSWKTIKTIRTLGPGFFMRSHENSPYAWTDVFFGPNNEAVHVINKQTLEIEKTLKPAPGKNAAHVEFDRYGKYALLSVWDMDGAIIVYDAKTLQELKRLPMVKPSGKYNVYNKITRSAGTSH